MPLNVQIQKITASYSNRGIHFEELSCYFTKAELSLEKFFIIKSSKISDKKIWIFAYLLWDIQTTSRTNVCMQMKFPKCLTCLVDSIIVGVYISMCVCPRQYFTNPCHNALRIYTSSSAEEMPQKPVLSSHNNVLFL